MKTRTANRFLKVAIIALVLSALLAVSSLALGLMENGLLLLEEGKTYTAQPYDITTGTTTGTANTVDAETNMLTAYASAPGIYEIKDNEGEKFYVFIPDATNNGKFTAAVATNKLADTITAGGWSINKTNQTVAAAQGLSVYSGNIRIQLPKVNNNVKNNLQHGTFYYGFTNEQVIPASATGVKLTLDMEIFQSVLKASTTVNVTFYAKSIGETEPTAYPATGVLVGTSTSMPIEFNIPADIPEDAYIVGVAIKPWSDTYANLYDNSTFPAPGSAYATIKLATTNVTYTALSYVTATPVASVEITDADPVSLKVGEEKQLSVSVLPETAHNKKVEWSSNDSTIVSVDANGKVKAVATAGSATITATSKDNPALSDTIVVEIEAYPTVDDNGTLTEGIDGLYVSLGNTICGLVEGHTYQYATYDGSAITSYLSELTSATQFTLGTEIYIRDVTAGVYEIITIEHTAQSTAAPAVTAGDAKLEGIEEGKYYRLIPYTINAAGTALKAGTAVYITSVNNSGLAGLYKVAETNAAHTVFTAETGLIYVPGDPDVRDDLGVLVSHANYSTGALDWQKSTDFIVGKWSTPGDKTHSVIGDAYGFTATGAEWLAAADITEIRNQINTYNALVNAGTASPGELEAALTAKNTAIKAILDKVNTKALKYAYQPEEIVSISDVLKFTFKSYRRMEELEYDKNTATFIAYVAQLDGSVTPHTFVTAENKITYNKDIEVDFTAGTWTPALPSTGYLVAIDVIQWAGLTDPNEVYLSKETSHNTMPTFKFVPDGYLIKKPATVPTLGEPTSVATGWNIVITNADTRYTYKYKLAGGEYTELAAGETSFTVTEPGTYTVEVSNDALLVGTATADVVVDYLTPVTPTFSGVTPASTGDAFQFSITSSTSGYVYEISVDGGQTWQSAGTTVTVPVSAIPDGETSVECLVRATGVAFNGVYANNSIIISTNAPSNPQPTEATNPTGNTFVFTIQDYKDYATYQYSIDGQQTWIDITSEVVNVPAKELPVGDTICYVKIGGPIYGTNVAIVEVTLTKYAPCEEPPALTYNKKTGMIEGFDTAKTYLVTKYTVNGAGTPTDFVPTATEQELAEGLYGIQIKSSSATLAHSNMTFVHVRGTEADRKTLGVLVSKTNGGNYEAVDTSRTFDWRQGVWTSHMAATHATYGNPYYIGSTGSDGDILSAKAQALGDAIAASDSAAELAARQEIKAISEAQSARYSYLDNEITPIDEFVSFKFDIGYRQGCVSFAAKTKLVLKVIDEEGNMVDCEWISDKFTITSTQTFNVTRAMLSNVPETGWIVAMEVFPWCDVAIDTISTSSSYGNTLPRLIYAADAHVVKIETTKPVLTVTDATYEGGYGEVVGFSKYLEYEYQTVGEGDTWHTIPAGTENWRAPAGNYYVRVRSTDTALASEEADVTISTLTGYDAYTRLENEVEKIHLASDFVEVKADYEVDLTASTWVSSLALENLKTKTPDSVIVFKAKNYKFVVTASNFETEKLTHYYNLAIEFEGASRHDTTFEIAKEYAGDSYITEFFIESADDLPFGEAELHVSVGTNEYDGYEVELRSYNERIDKLRKVETSVIEDGWAIFTNYEGAYVIVTPLD